MITHRQARPGERVHCADLEPGDRAALPGAGPWAATIVAVVPASRGRVRVTYEPIHGASRTITPVGYAIAVIL